MTICVEKASFTIKENKILDDVSLSVNPGELTSIIGPNGAGKSTLLKLMSGDVKPDAGKVYVNGETIESIDVKRLSILRTVMSQQSSIIFDFYVDEILAMGWVNGNDRQRVDVTKQVIEWCHIGHLIDRRFGTLSGGEQRLVQFARALLQVSSPLGLYANRSLLLDEPTASLDLSHELLVIEQAKAMARRGTGVMVVLHDLNLAARFADRIVLMSEGSIVLTGRPNVVLQEDLLSEVYGTPITVECHKSLNRLVVYS